MDILHTAWSCFRARRSDKLSRQLALEVAHRSRGPVLEQVGGWNHFMSRPETCGYIRARAARIILQQTREVLARYSNLPTAVESEVIRQATEHVVCWVASDLADRVAAQTRRLRAA
jgi:hypothetical protein